jgi:hypothetical protein
MGTNTTTIRTIDGVFKVSDWLQSRERKFQKEKKHKLNEEQGFQI